MKIKQIVLQQKWADIEKRIYNTDENMLKSISKLKTEGGIGMIEMLKFEPEGDLTIVLEKVE
ncbi:hypothetical protein ACFLU5_15595 [Bacteroidota bacterium]